MPSSSAPRRSDACSNASASQKLGSYVCHDPMTFTAGAGLYRRRQPLPTSYSIMPRDTEDPGSSAIGPVRPGSTMEATEVNANRFASGAGGRMCLEDAE